MGYWKDSIESHAAFLSIESLLEELENEDSFNIKESDECIFRTRLVLEKTLKLLVGLDADFVPKSSLDNLHSYVEAIGPNLTQMRSYRASAANQAPARTQIDTLLDNILQSLGQIRAAAIPISKDSVFEKLGFLKLDTRSKLKDIVKGLEAEVADVQSELVELEKQIANNSAALKDEKVRLDSLVNQFQSDFHDSQKEREANFKLKVEKEYAGAFRAKLKEVVTAFETQRENALNHMRELDSATVKTVADLEGHATNAGLVAEAIAQKAFKTEFEKNANAEKVEALKWSRITLGVVVVMVVFVGFVLYMIINNEHLSSPETAIPKLLLTAILVGVARWTAKLEKRHTDEARKYKQLALELETISPFIATLPEEEKRQIIRMLVDRYFVGRNGESGNSVKDDDDSFKHPAEQIGGAFSNLLSKKD